MKPIGQTQTGCLRQFGRGCVITASLLLALGLRPEATLAATYGNDNTTHLQKTFVGGMPASPVITSLKTVSNRVTITWSGIADPNLPFQLQHNPTMKSNGWVTVSNTWYKTATLPATLVQAFRVTSPSPEFAGADTCATCHTNSHHEWMATRHATALQTLKSIGMHNNASCLGCHTVGYGLPTGFKSEATTPQFAGVQCENCHGPAAAHASNPEDRSMLPPVELAATLCGGCHTDSHHPTFDEFSTALHSRVDPHVQAYFVDPVSGVGRMNSCGPCHSGAVRVSMLAGEPLPSGHEAEQIGVTCATCHDSHAKTANGHQLRNPVASTNFINWNTSLAFSNQYNPNISLCGQCHNARGAAVTDTSRPPHHSGQYNMLLGNLGVTVTNQAAQMTPHWTITNQCVGCHMQSYSVATPTDLVPNGTGHSFKPNLKDACLDCHTSDAEWMDLLVEFTQEATKERIAVVKSNLVLWATTKAPLTLRNKYKEFAWEYTTPGQISLPNGGTNVGPTTAEQNNATNGVPLGIKQARFNLYLVEHDGSYGAHNNSYSRYLLKVAEDKVKAELAK
jgi:hypothetical protein